MTIFTADVKMIKSHNNYNVLILLYACAYLYDINLL